MYNNISILPRAIVYV